MWWTTTPTPDPTPAPPTDAAANSNESVEIETPATVTDNGIDVAVEVMTDMPHGDLVQELANVREHLATTREALWGCQDKLGKSEKTMREMQNHISDLVETRDNDHKLIESLKTENARALEEEAKVRESLELMKKVFTRSQIRAKADQESLKTLREERDKLKTENAKLLEENILSLNDKFTLTQANKKATENEKNLNMMLQKTRSDLAGYQKNKSHADGAIKQLTSRLVQKNGQQKNQQKMISKLEKKVRALFVAEEREESSNFVNRALFDEDLEDGVARQILQTVDCTSFNEEMLQPRLDCTSFTDQLAVSGYSFGSKPQTSM